MGGSLAAEIAALGEDLVETDADAHPAGENSIELQTGLVRGLLPEARIVPIMVPPAAVAVRFGTALGRLLALGEGLRGQDRPGHVRKLEVGAPLLLKGTIVVGRDIAHAKFKEILDSGKPLPDYLKNHPIYYAGPAKTPAGKASGVVIQHQLTDVEISALPKNLPEFIAVDLSRMDAGDAVMLSDIQLPEGVVITALEGEAQDAAVANAIYISEDQGTGAAAAAEAEAAAADELAEAGAPTVEEEPEEGEEQPESDED